jgi:signal transduction histidine kinase
MAHEINNPLGIISQAALMIKKRFDPASQSNVAAAQDIGIELLTLQEYLEKRHIFEYLDSIGEASSRASDIIRSTLNFSRMSKSQPVRVDVHSLLEQSISFISRDYDIKKNFDFKRINIVRNYDASVTSIVCRQTEIEQVMLNLLKNAAQALGESSSQSPEIELSTGIKGEYLSITVKNNGPEIPENLLNRIFEPFYTTKEAEKGTGLGLSVSKYIIEELHSGLLRVESKRSLGTLFTILLPFSG